MLSKVKCVVVLLLAVVLLLGYSSGMKAMNRFEEYQDRKTGIKPFEVGKVESYLPKNEVKIEKYFYTTEPMPAYPGGEKAMNEFLKKNLVYSNEARSAGLEGSVTVRFLVNADGSLTEIEILQGVHPLLDKAVMDVVKKMPKWIMPGKSDDRKIPAYLTLPVIFRLSESSDHVQSVIPIGYMYVVDGVEMSESDVMKIKKQDIKSIDMLKKDKAKVILARYGYSEDDKKGIILITLKKKK